FYQRGVQSTGYRTSPDVSLVADPNTGAWVADPYNLPGDNPWEIVGGTSLSAPCWAGLIALANQARAQAGLPTFNSSSPTEIQQALYNVPVPDFHDVTSGTNGYAAGVGYDLVTGLGTPLADRLIPDLVAYHGAINTQRTITVTSANAVVGGSGGGSGGPMNAVFRVFNAELGATSGLRSVIRAASVSERVGALANARCSDNTNSAATPPLLAAPVVLSVAPGVTYQANVGQVPVASQPAGEEEPLVSARRLSEAAPAGLPAAGSAAPAAHSARGEGV